MCPFAVKLRGSSYDVILLRCLTAESCSSSRRHRLCSLAEIHSLRDREVSNWFANARRRLKNTVQGEGISWSRRIQAYNDFAEGNAELFSIPSSEEEEEEEEEGGEDLRPCECIAKLNNN
ncbi:homeobox protein Mohawk-like [Elysia marginata]|uniref:Homeobox protein Mohawk-like n=1 Tax=Elysia marginata TaxID=1093978 RepID=A0AAV4IXL8_9GAST|nr:homeobox protein Mohawk-like [Elysia marginata]